MHYNISAPTVIMQTVVLLLVSALTAAAAVPAVPALTRQTKIIGGNVAVISQYPSTVALLYSSDNTNYYQACVGSILTTRSIVTAGHCLQGDGISKWRARVGSSWANSGGYVYILSSMLIHPKFNVRTMDSDIALVYTAVKIAYSNVVGPASIAGATYNLPDNQVVWAVGFGAYAAGNSDQLRHIQIWSINQATCASRYGILGSNVTSNMVCAGLLSSGSNAQCVGDSGGPLFHTGVLVGVYSWGFSCASPAYPGVDTRVSKFTTWIQNNAY